MAKFISKSQMEELEDACTFGIEGANKLLKKYAGIQARAYTAYNYYDENDNFLANSDETDLDDLLEKANVVGTPGSGFGPSGEGYFRLTAFGNYENTVKALERIKAL